MSTHKHIDKICIAAVAIVLVIALLFLCGADLGIQIVSKAMGYEKSLFDTSKVHTIDIIIDDWDAFIQTAQSEEYSVCSVVIDGETVKNVGIRGKGNTSLSSVSSMGSERYSFKIEFDQYDSTKNYHGLDKLCLNNLIQDNTYMKDYLVYQMMNEVGVDVPLCSFAYITVNGEDWGLYLAVEAVEESFLQRSYGSNYGDLYKPDSLSFGGGRGNGKDFDMADFMNSQESASSETSSGTSSSEQVNPFGNMQMPEGFSMPNGFDPTQGAGGNGGFTMPEGFDFTQGGGFTMPDGMDFSFGDMAGAPGSSASESDTSGKPDMGGFGGSGGFGMGSSDVKLQYIDDDPDSYSNIFSSAKTNVTAADQARLIESLKRLSSYEDLENLVDTEQVLRYFVVHNFVVNGDSYTGSMIHNYYLYEENGRLSMIPWDYNLAFGTFNGGNASSSVNDAIDDVLTDRPMQAWIFSDEAYAEQYYTLYEQLLSGIDIEGIIERAYTLITPYVEKDPTAFCTYEEFELGVQTLKSFCSLRSESVQRQLDGNTEAVDASGLDLSAMGTMGGGMGGGRRSQGEKADRADNIFSGKAVQPERENSAPMAEASQNTDGMTFPEGFDMSREFDMSGTDFPEGSVIPQGTETPTETQTSDSSASEGQSSVPSKGKQSGWERPTGMTPPNGSMNAGSMSAVPSEENLLTLLVCVIALIAALIFAKFYKRRR